MALQLNWVGRVRLGAMLAISAPLILLPVLSSGAKAQNAPAAPGSAPGTTTAPSTPSEISKPIVDQVVLDLLKKATARIADAKGFSVRTLGSREVPSSQGQMLTFFDTVEVDVKRPNKLKAEISAGGSDVNVYYDGKTLTVSDDDSKLYAVTPAPATLDAFVTDVAQKQGIYLPMADFIASDPFKQLTTGLTNAYDAGVTEIDGRAVRHLAFARPGLEYQLWLDAKTDLPRMMGVTYLDAPRAPHFTVTFKDWKFRDKPDSDFEFTPGRRAVKIDFLPASR